MSEPLSVYVVEDDAGVMAAVLAALARPANGFHLAGASPSGVAAPELVADGAIDIFVTDWRLPDADGLDLIARAKELRPGVRAVLITGHYTPDLTFRALLAGADVILFKPFNADELCDSLRAALSGQRVLCAEAARHMNEFLRQNRAVKAAPAADEALTDREVELMTWLKQDMTLKEAADRMGISESTAATHRKHIYGKLKVHKLQGALTKFQGGQDFRASERRTDAR